MWRSVHGSVGSRPPNGPAQGLAMSGLQQGTGHVPRQQGTNALRYPVPGGSEVNIPHGLPGYRKGCRCPECSQAKSEFSKASRHRRIRETPYERIPHGVNGYYGYACRCEICRLAASDKTKERRATKRDDTPHGSVNGYTNYACRCIQCSESYRNAKRERDLRNRYGITQAEFLDLRQGQGNKCAICFSGFGDRPGSVDHDHATGQVRGVLCSACNTGLGAVRDDPERLMNLIRYLDRTDKLE